VACWEAANDSSHLPPESAAGLRTTEFQFLASLSVADGLASTLFTVGGGAITLERGFDFYLLSADFGLVTVIETPPHATFSGDDMSLSNETFM
jgi:hypothetical protein